MPFLTPLYLLGTIAAGIPIVIHMIHRRRAQRVLFPTIRFLKTSNERTSRRQRIQDLLLLLLRVLLLVLLAAALAQPFLARGTGGKNIKAVILLDNSYSMGTEHERTARIQAAKKLAGVVIDALPNGAEAALMLACPPHGHAPPMLSDDRERLRADILKAPLSQARADLTAAVARAYDLLAEEKATNQEIYVLTDLQRNAWPEPPRDQAAKRKVEPNLVVIDCGREDHENLAVAELIVRGG
ncbi:BatA domain-containing protein, partial [Planctomycetota bacterium]